MDALKKQRASLRIRLAYTVKELDKEIAKEFPDSDEVTVKLKKLSRNLKAVEEVDEKIQLLMSEADCSVADYEAELLEADTVSSPAWVLKVKIEKLLSGPVGGSDSSSSSGGSSIESKRTYKLPTIEIKKFNGDLTEWLSFWSQFEKIHKDDSIHASDKFQYLVQSMVPGTRVQKLVEGMPITEDNYPKVIQSLTERYGDNKKLTQVYVAAMVRMGLAFSQSKEKVRLVDIYDKLSSHLQALVTLGVTAEQTTHFLFPMVEAGLPEDVLIAWQRSPNCGRDGALERPPMTELDYLMEFLKAEVDSEEHRLRLKNEFFGDRQQVKRSDAEKKGKTSNRLGRHSGESVPTAAGLHVGNSEAVVCIFCSKTNHPSEKCFLAKRMTLEDRAKIVKAKWLCIACFREGHQAKFCKSGVKCGMCGRNHHNLMCRDSGKVDKPKESQTVMVNSNCVRGGLVLLYTLLVKVTRDGPALTLRVLFDQGSQGSYITSRAAKAAHGVAIGSFKEQNTVFGGLRTPVETRKIFRLRLTSMDDKVSKVLEIPDKEKITSNIPRLPPGPWQEELMRKGIMLTDVGTGSEEIDILIGADLLPQLTKGTRNQDCGMTAMNTVFGWAVMGPLPAYETPSAMLVTALTVTGSSVSQLWDLETLGIRDPAEIRSKVEVEAEVHRHFLSKLQRNNDGRYRISLPWIDGDQEIPCNLAVSQKRLQCTTARLKRDGQFEAYDSLFKSWEQESFIEEVNDLEKENHRSHYLPHRAVYKPESLTTPVRPVFDASCKSGRNPSLNDCLEKGPNYIELIPSVMLRFREGKIGFVSDIRKAFQMIEINNDDRNYVRFLWWDSHECTNVKVFRHCRVVFGVNCSPFLLGAVINHHLDQVLGPNEELAKKLKKAFYVDNCVSSVDSMEEYVKFKTTAINMMAEAQMDLRQWEHGVENEPTGGTQTSTDEATSITSVLGMKWDRASDTLSCDRVPELPETFTKRSLLSTVQKVFDPMGFLSPATLIPKLILQEAWTQKLGWDEQLPEETTSKFRIWSKELSCLEQVRIPRYMTSVCNHKTLSFHVFCDASQYAYAAAVFLRTSDDVNKNVAVQLLQSKSRVAPIKKMTIPRLELMACVIATRLAASVKEALAYDISTYYWSDSTTALAWIRRNDEWGTFVGNRVKEICSLSRPADWRHVPGVHNPADLPSRGCSPQELLRSQWWEGPAWLRQAEPNWPTESLSADESSIAMEKRKGSTQVLVATSKAELPWYVKTFASYSKCVRLVAWIRRFKCNVLKKIRPRIITKSPREPLTVEELALAERTLFGIVQREVFPVQASVINGLQVIRGIDNMYYVKTKLLNLKDTSNFRLPVLLPHDHPLVERLIRGEHLTNGHAGVQLVMSRLRERCWIINSRKAIRRVVHKCVTCRRYAAKPPEVPFAPLPEDRVKMGRVFEVTGIDLAGPLILRDKTKAWIVLFTCAVFRAVHLEIVISLNTDSFLLALLRFMSRRGRPAIIYSDNLTNFVGATTLFKELDWTRIQRETDQVPIIWKFNPPSAAWWGGWWERLIRTVKNLLRKMLGHGKLNYIQMETCLCQVEAVVNSRPLTYVTEDPEDLIPLTPAMFLQDLQCSNNPEVLALDAVSLRGKHRELLVLKQELQQRFRLEYLGLLAHRGSRRVRDFQVGEVVLMATDKKRLLWPMARIVELLPGKDGKVRVARIKTSTGEFVRPLQRLFPLEVQPETSQFIVPPEVKKRAKAIKASPPETIKPVVTRSGRVVKKKVRFSC